MKIYKISQNLNPYKTIAYHGTIHDFDQFNVLQIGKSNDFGTLGKGFYFTLDPYVANSYARTAYKKFKGDKTTLVPQIITVNINLQNAFNTSQRTIRMNYNGNSPEEQADSMTQELYNKNIDGVLLSENNEISEIIVYNPSKISIIKKTPVDVSDLK